MKRYSLISKLKRACDIGVFNKRITPKKCHRKKEIDEEECDLDISHLVKTGETKQREDIEWLFKIQQSIIEEDKDNTINQKESDTRKEQNPGNSFDIDLEDNINLPTNINRKNTVVIQKKNDENKVNQKIQSNRFIGEKIAEDYGVEFGDHINDEDSFIVVNKVKNIFNTNNSQMHVIEKLSLKEEREKEKEAQNTSNIIEGEDDKDNEPKNTSFMNKLLNMLSQVKTESSKQIEELEKIDKQMSLTNSPV